MSDDINRIMKCLTLSVNENEIKNLESLSWAINKLENFSMTFETLDRSRIGQILQSVRHSKKISLDISGRIRNLIKCWRKLLNDNCQSVIPNEIKNGIAYAYRSTGDINGIKNGIIKENIVLDSTNINGNDSQSCKDLDKSSNVLSDPKESDENEKYKREINFECDEKTKDEISHENDEEKICEKPMTIDSNVAENLQLKTEINNDQYSPKDKHVDCNTVEMSINTSHSDKNKKDISSDAETDKTISQPQSQSVDEITKPINDVNQNCFIPTDMKPPMQIGKPKLKSTKELLADFSNLIDNDTKNKILLGKIAQEDDQVSYHPEEFRLREIMQQRNLFIPKEPARPPSPEKIIDFIDLSDDHSPQNEKPKWVKESKCDRLLKKFSQLCDIKTTVLLRPLVPWKNLKRGIDCSSPYIKIPKQHQQQAAKRNLNCDSKLVLGEPPNKLSINDIDDLLKTYELRAQRKDMITDAILKRKEMQIATDNTQTLEDMSLKLKLKIKPKLPTLKITKKSRRKKKKKRKLKDKVPVRKAPPLPRVKKPVKPRLKPKPPVTNFLDDLPKLPDLFFAPDSENLISPSNVMLSPSLTLQTESLPSNGRTESESVAQKTAPDYSEDSVHQFTYGIVDGYNCTKQSQTMEIVELTKMYSLLINENYYFHVFPWVDLQFPSKPMFSSESDDIIKSAFDFISDTDFV